MVSPFIQNLGDGVISAQATELRLSLTLYSQHGNDKINSIFASLSHDRGSMNAVLSPEECETFAELFTRAAVALRGIK